MKKKTGSTDDDDLTHLINVNIYDTHSSSTILKIYSNTMANDICKAIANKIDLSPEDAKFHSLVLVLTVFNTVKNYNIHCVRTLRPTETIIDVLSKLIGKLSSKHKINDTKELRDSARWYYKDIRTVPIDLGDAGEVSGEYSSDEESNISHSDLAYLGT
jgi:hypothetical protein